MENRQLATENTIILQREYNNIIARKLPMWDNIRYKYKI